MNKSDNQKKSEIAAKKERNLVYSGRIITVFQDKLYLENQKTAIVDHVFHPGAVAILPINQENKIICIKQWRRAAQTILLEIPAGVLEKDEDPLSAAQRELQEEIGFRPGILIPLGGIYTAPGFCTEYIYFFIAKDLMYDPLWADDTDYIDIVSYSLEELLALVGRGEITDSKTLSALFLYQQWLKNQELE